MVGNGELIYPVALITVDETFLAGISDKNANNHLNWLTTGQFFWTMSPSYFSNYRVSSAMWNVVSEGVLYNYGWTNCYWLGLPQLLI